MSKKAENKDNKTEKNEVTNKKIKKDEKNKVQDAKEEKDILAETFEKVEKNKTKVKVDEIEETDILAETLKERKKMPKEVKGKITDTIFSSIIMIMLMLIINFNITVLYVNYSSEKFQEYIKIFQIGVCFGTIAIFEYSYRKDSFKKALYGIEFLIFSIAVLYVPYMYILKENLDFMNNVIKIFIVYYIIKSLVYFIYTKRKFSKENLSDVKEIVKKEEKEGYLDD